MTEHTTTQCVLFPELFGRPVVAQFDEAQGSSDGGAILLKAADQRLQLTAALVACLKDERQAVKVEVPGNSVCDVAAYCHLHRRNLDSSTIQPGYFSATARNLS